MTASAEPYSRALSVGLAKLRLRWGVPALLLIVCLALRIAFLTSQSLWYDEGFSLAYSQGPTPIDTLRQITAAAEGDQYQALYYVILLGWRSLFGNGEWALRSLSVVLGLLAGSFVFATASRAYGRAHGTWSLAFAALSAMAIYYSQEARPYALILFVASVQLWAFLEIIQKTNARTTLVSPVHWIFWISIAVGFATSVLLVLFTASTFVADLFVRRDLRSAIRLWIPLVPVAAAAVLLYGLAFVSQKAGVITPLSGSVLRNAIFVVYGLLVGPTYGPSVEDLHAANQLDVVFAYWPTLALLGLVVLFLLGLVLRGLRSPAKGAGRVDHVLIVVLVVAFVLDVIFAMIARLNWLPRHSIYLLVPIFLLLPIATRRQDAQSSGRGWRQLGALALTALLILNIYSLAHYYFDPQYARDDYRATAAYLVRERGPSGASIMLWGRPDLLAYYGDALTIDGRGLDETNIDEQIWRATNGNPRVVVAVNRDFYWNTAGVSFLDQQMARRYKLIGTASFPYFVVHTFELLPAASRALTDQ